MAPAFAHLTQRQQLKQDQERDAVLDTLWRPNIALDTPTGTEILLLLVSTNIGDHDTRINFNQMWYKRAVHTAIQH